MVRRNFVKVCGICERENAHAIAHCGVDYLGFIFVEDSPRYVEPNDYNELLVSLPPFVKSVAVFRDASHAELADIVLRYNFAAVQLHGNEDSAYIAECKRRVPGCEVFKAVTLSNSGETSLNLPQGTDLFIFDGACPGSGKEFDWGLIRKYTGETPFLLAGGIGPHNIQQVRELMRENHQCVGVDINSRVELRVGVKDEQAVRAVLEGVRV